MISPRNACLLCFPTSSPLHSFFSWEQRIADLSLSGEVVLRFEGQTKCPGCLANTGFYLLLYECFLPGNSQSCSQLPGMYMCPGIYCHFQTRNTQNDDLKPVENSVVTFRCISHVHN